MLLCAVIFLIFANLLNHSKGIHTEVKTAILYIAYLWLILIFSFRGLEVPDTKAYMRLYYADTTASNFEYLFSILCNMAKSFGLGFYGFLFVFQLLLFSIWFIASRKLFNDIHLAFMVFLPFMGIYNFGIIIRAGMGLCMCYFSMVYLLESRDLKHYVGYFCMVTLAVLFHQSMIVFYIVPFFVFRKFNSIILLIIILVSVLIPLFNIQHLIANFLESYINLFSFNKFLSYTKLHAKFNLQGVYSLTMIKYTIMAVIFIWLRSKVTAKQEVYNCFLNIYITGVLLIALTYFISAGNRLSYIFFFFEFVLVGILYENSSIPKINVLIGAVGLCILNYLNIISALPVMVKY